MISFRVPLNGVEIHCAEVAVAANQFKSPRSHRLFVRKLDMCLDDFVSAVRQLEENTTCLCYTEACDKPVPQLCALQRGGPSTIDDAHAAVSHTHVRSLPRNGLQ